MISLPNGCKLLQDTNELPSLFNVNELFCDFETKSGDPRVKAFSPWKGHKIAGIAITADDINTAYYIPIDHKPNLLFCNLHKPTVMKWLDRVLSTCKRWINHNVLFDATFAHIEGIEFGGELIDTLTMSKFIDSDRFTYDLKDLSKEWLGVTYSSQDRLKSYLEGIKSKDYGDSPQDICGEYACDDVINNRNLWRFIQSKYESSMKMAWETEIKLTPVLYDMQNFGMPVDRQELIRESLTSIFKQNVLAERLKNHLGMDVNPSSHNQVYDVLINQLGLPVLCTNEENGNASFNKEAMGQYQVHPLVTSSEKNMNIVKTLKGLRDEAHFKSLFLDGYLDLAESGILHPQYVQCLRTGRMGCKQPNAQQLNSRAKALIHPHPGYGIISSDYSQIEFRIIVHYIKDEAAIKAYNEDPKTDFHAWVSSICKVKRKAAKCLNFGMGFGAGRPKVVSMLVSNEVIIEEVGNQINQEILAGTLHPSQRNIEFNHRCRTLANESYSIYHQRLPGIKATSNKASDTAKARGYVFNNHGRRRHLKSNFCYKAFNSVVQSDAADLMKERTVELAPRYNKVSRDIGLKIFASVHDDTSMMVPLDRIQDPFVHNHIRTTLETSNIQYRVPIMTEMGFSLSNWAEASKEEAVLNTEGLQIGGRVVRSN